MAAAVSFCCFLGSVAGELEIFDFDGDVDCFAVVSVALINSLLVGVVETLGFESDTVDDDVDVEEVVLPMDKKRLPSF